MRALFFFGLLLPSAMHSQVPVDVMPEDTGPIALLTPGTYPLHITVRNLDLDYAIESLQAHWQLDAGPVHSCSVQEFLVFPELLYPTFHDRFTHADPLTLPATGTYTLKVWTSMPGGFPDIDPSNDTITTSITVVEALPPKHVVMFYGTHVDCFPCGTYGEPAVEAVLDSFPSNVHLITAHDHPLDPYTVPEGTQFNELYIWPYTGHPAFVFDIFPMPFYADITTHYWGELWRSPDWRGAYMAPVEVTVEALTFDTNTRVLSGEVHADFWVDHAGALAINAVITEDSIYGPQNGVPGGYVHHRHVLRDLTAGLFGDNSVVPSAVSAGQEFVYTFSDTLAPDVNEANVYVVGYVQVDDPDPLQREILNSGAARLGGTIGNGTADEEAASPIRVFPNPADRSLVIDLSGVMQRAFFIVRDLSGRTCMRGGLDAGRNMLDVGRLAEGSYTLDVRSDAGQLFLEKVIIQRR